VNLRLFEAFFHHAIGVEQLRVDPPAEEWIGSVGNDANRIFVPYYTQ
jgi:hypothetical protein